MTPYQILGVSEQASTEDIKKAYRNLARQHHPDRNPGDPEAEAKFKKIQEAYDQIGEPKAKQAYERNNKPFTTVFEDFFGNFFNDSPRQGKNINKEIWLTLEQIYFGGEVELKFSRKIRCKTCSGAGGTTQNCTKCNGQGKVPMDRSNSVWQICGRCNGTGKMLTSKCTDCKNGLVDGQENKVSFTAPIGMEDGTHTFFDNLGNESLDPNGKPGQLLVAVRIQPHKRFKLANKTDLIITIPVSYAQLLLGSTLTVPTMSSPVSIKIPARTHPGAKLRLKGQGMPIARFANGKHRYGDLYVELELDIPEEVNEEYVKVLEQLLELEKANPGKAIKTFKETQ